MAQTIHLVCLDLPPIGHAVDREGLLASGILRTWVAPGRGAMAKLRHLKPDILLVSLDEWQGPFKAGIEQIFQLDGYDHVPWLGASVRPAHPLWEQAQALGAAGFVELPIPSEYLIEQIKQWLAVPRRQMPRVEALGWAQVRDAGGKVEAKVKVLDVSLGGVLVEGEISLLRESGRDQLQVRLGFLGEDSEAWLSVVRTRVAVVRGAGHDGVRGVGLQFQQLPPAVEQALRRYIAERLGDKMDHLSFYY